MDLLESLMHLAICFLQFVYVVFYSQLPLMLGGFILSENGPELVKRPHGLIL